VIDDDLDRPRLEDVGKRFAQYGDESNRQRLPQCGRITSTMWNLREWLAPAVLGDSSASPFLDAPDILGDLGLPFLTAPAVLGIFSHAFPRCAR